MPAATKTQKSTAKMRQQRRMWLSATLGLIVGTLVTTTQWTLANGDDVVTSSQASQSGIEDENGTMTMLELPALGTDITDTEPRFPDMFPSSEYDDDFSINFELNHHEQEEHDREWDILIFTQQWPVTTCFEWREANSKHQCQLPDDSEYWEIHGIWPTKLGQLGPSFCNMSADFNLAQLKQIEDELQMYWGTIHRETGSDWLWRHEWMKHGTCAAILEQLNNELKYFKKGLEWRDKYLISNILEQSEIYPDSNNTVIALQTAMLKVLGKNPSIHCVYNNKMNMSYLSEIRICFNKSLELTDCDGVLPGDAKTIEYPGGTVNTNCHISKSVNYPSTVPPVNRQKASPWKFPVVNMYKLLQFVMWFTL